MPKADHPDGAETITHVVTSSLPVASCRRQREYPKATSLNRSVLPGVGTT